MLGFPIPGIGPTKQLRPCGRYAAWPQVALSRFAAGFRSLRNFNYDSLPSDDSQTKNPVTGVILWLFEA
jgi:hypothetical protein